MQESRDVDACRVFMLGAAYTLKRDEHVRVDVFYRKLPSPRSARSSIWPGRSSSVPMAGFLVVASWDYVSTSWAIREARARPAGCRFRSCRFSKRLIPLTASMLLLQGSRSLGAIAQLPAGAVPDDGEQVSHGDVI